MKMTDDRLSAIIAESQHNQRTNPAAAADQQYQPEEWTPEMEAELMRNRYGTDEERLSTLLAEQNERTRRT